MYDKEFHFSKSSATFFVRFVAEKCHVFCVCRVAAVRVGAYHNNAHRPNHVYDCLVSVILDPLMLSRLGCTKNMTLKQQVNLCLSHHKSKFLHNNFTSAIIGMWKPHPKAFSLHLSSCAKMLHYPFNYANAK